MTDDGYHAVARLGQRVRAMTLNGGWDKVRKYRLIEALVLSAAAFIAGVFVMGARTNNAIRDHADLVKTVIANEVANEGAHNGIIHDVTVMGLEISNLQTGQDSIARKQNMVVCLLRNPVVGSPGRERCSFR